VQSGELIRSAAVVAQLNAPDGVTCVKFSPNGRILASGARNGIVRLWDAASGLLSQTIQAVHGPNGGVFSVSFSPDGNTLAAGSDDNVIQLWTVQPNVPLRQYLSVDRFDGLELKPLSAANLYGYDGFKARTTQEMETKDISSGVSGQGAEK
jgi:WD40 repeat protein